jgi:hypothetical protein
VSTLLLPNAARTIFWTTYTSSLVHRDDVIAPIEPVPCSAWISCSRRAVNAIASSQLTSRHGSSIVSRSIGERTRSACVA